MSQVRMSSSFLKESRYTRPLMLVVLAGACAATLIVIVTHGTNSDRSSMLPELRVLAGAGYGALGFDWLSAQSDVDPTRIGGLGFSIGAFVMTQVAAA